MIEITGQVYLGFSHLWHKKNFFFFFEFFQIVLNQNCMQSKRYVSYADPKLYLMGEKKKNRKVAMELRFFCFGFFGETERGGSLKGKAIFIPFISHKFRGKGSQRKGCSYFRNKRSARGGKIRKRPFFAGRCRRSTGGAIWPKWTASWT